MQHISAQSPHANQAYQLVNALQQRFVKGLETIAISHASAQVFKPVEWLRDDGIHGGGTRLATADGDLFGRGSVNVSQVHYDENPNKKLGSATAISTIIHPCMPQAPSVHIHISWTEMKDGQGYWRMMADLNPSIENPIATQQFFTAMQQAAPNQYEEAITQGDRYFHIPVLGRHRGVSHFYLEQYSSDDAQADLALATKVGEVAIDTYLDILSTTLDQNAPVTVEAKAAQLAYHSLYFLQVLTLDRGTTTGLMVHNQNDLGILGSLPAYVDAELLRSWVAKMPHPQEQLLSSLIEALPKQTPSLVDDAVKQKLANISRSHYSLHPQALSMQASGDVIPPTLKNHRN
ncbi:MAG: coproporphyrinogen III oxidase [Mariprofundaceae bacterium]